MLTFQSFSGDALANQPPKRISESRFQNIPPISSAKDSLRQLLDSLSREQLVNQELLVSLGFALRSFTNLHRFLEIVPVVASRLVGVEGALKVLC